MVDVSTTITPKSDQLNADDLIARPITIAITKVSLMAGEQPIAINYQGDNNKPWKPCKSMRRILVMLWGSDGAAYIGRSMTLYREPTVKFGGADVGGIRISHLSHIDESVTVSLTASKAQRKPYTVRPLVMPKAATLSDVLAAIEAATTKEERAASKAMVLTLSDSDQATAKAAYNARGEAMKSQPVSAESF